MKSRLITTLAIAVLLVGALPALVAAGDQRSGPMQTLPGLDVIDGTHVSVNASGQKARLRIKTQDLVGGNAYTVWSFSFSHPRHCQHGTGDALCGPGDDGAGPQGFKVQYVAGHPIGGNGKANFGGSIVVPNAAGAEYHIVIADHGAKDPAQLPGQIKTPSMNVVQIGFIYP